MTIGPHEAMGEVFTRRWVVEWMLDLIGYTPDQPLYGKRILEPACGDGAFLLPIVQRLVASCRLADVPLADTQSAIVAMDLHAPSVETTSKAVIAALESEGMPSTEAEALAGSWLRASDFLLDDAIPTVEFVAGNPPYVRLEDVPADLARRYRDRWTTMGGRADLYIGFYERGLRQLREGGSLGFICADRWMRNTYGRRLRNLIYEGPFSMDSVIRLHDVDCFEEEVSAYPAITLLRHGDQGDGVVLDASSAFGPDDVQEASLALHSGSSGSTFSVGRVEGWFGADVWPEGTPQQLAEVADHETRHEPLEDVLRQTRVGIGVASGADGIFLTDDPDLVETDRLLPVAMARHIADGSLRWTPKFLVNPWDSNGLVRLDDFPLLQAYFETHRPKLEERHTARKTPNRWYKTIDRVHPWLTDTPKILLADMKARMTPVVDPGGLYPHHNLYWVTSVRWDLEVLAGLLLSDQAELFVRAYCVKMRGGTLRMQAQYLRRIRLPAAESLTDDEREGLRHAYTTYDRELATAVAKGPYAR